MGPITSKAAVCSAFVEHSTRDPYKVARTSAAVRLGRDEHSGGVTSEIHAITAIPFSLANVMGDGLRRAEVHCWARVSLARLIVM